MNALYRTESALRRYVLYVLQTLRYFYTAVCKENNYDSHGLSRAVVLLLRDRSCYHSKNAPSLFDRNNYTLLSYALIKRGRFASRLLGFVYVDAVFITFRLSVIRIATETLPSVARLFLTMQF